MKKREKDGVTLGNFYSPYRDNGDNMEAWYKTYMNDAEKTIEIDGRVYSKIIHRCEFYIYNDYVLLITFEPNKNWCVGDILVDECGREFELMSVEMVRYSSPIPDWAFKIISIAIKGQDYSIGNYIALK